jgi:hypothetical protein
MQAAGCSALLRLSQTAGKASRPRAPPSVTQHPPRRTWRGQAGVMSCRMVTVPGIGQSAAKSPCWVKGSQTVREGVLSTLSAAPNIQSVPL